MRILLAIVVTLAAAWAGYWFIGSRALNSGISAWFDARRGDGWVADYSDLAVQGFPSRFDTSFTDPHLIDPVSGLGWQAPFFQLLTLSYKPNHVIAVWPHEQRIETPGQAYTLTSRDMRASLVVAASTTLALKRSTLTAEGIVLTPEGGEGALSVDTLRLAVARGEDAQDTGEARYHLGLAAEALAPPARLLAQIDPDDTLARVIDTVRADVTVDFTAPWDRHALQGARPQPTRIAVKNAEIRWGAMRLAASGQLEVAPDGTPTGTLTVSAHNWRQMLEAATAAKLLTPDMSETAERALGMMAGNEETKALEVPLDFNSGRIWIGPVPIGPAPVLRLQ